MKDYLIMVFQIAKPVQKGAKTSDAKIPKMKPSLHQVYILLSPNICSETKAVRIYFAPSRHTAPPIANENDAPWPHCEKSRSRLLSLFVTDIDVGLNTLIGRVYCCSLILSINNKLLHRGNE